MNIVRLRELLRRVAFTLACVLALPFPALAASSGSQYSPKFSPGLLVGLICYGRKRKAIGGWLAFFYWQLYSGLFVTALMFAMNIESYVPENFANTYDFALFLASSVPGMLLFVIEAAVATLLLFARTWDLLRLLRWTMVAGLIATIVGAGIDAAHFPDNLPLSILGIVTNSLWLAYIFRSKRVRHVFYLRDWEVAVSYIHPLKLTTAT
jgi:hypothetical protein